MAAQLGKFTKKKKKHWIVHMKWVNYTIYKICLKKVKQQQQQQKSHEHNILPSIYPLAGSMRLLV